MIEVNGMAHVILSVSEWDACRAFYRRLMPFLGMTQTFDGEEMNYYVGGRTAIGISRCAPEFEQQRFRQTGVGLHHLCLRARSRADVDAVYRELLELEATIVHPPQVEPWAPGYYSVLFEDPAGIRLEINFVPGKGLLAEDVSFSPGEDYR